MRDHRPVRAKTAPKRALCTSLLSLLAACGGGGGGTPPPPVKTVTALPTSSSTVALSGDDLTLVSVNQDLDSVSIFDVSADTPKKLGEVVVGGEPRSVAVLPNAGKAYVACATSGSVAVVDLATRQITAKVPVGVEPRAVVPSPNGSRVYVANSVSGTVSVLDTSSNSVIATIAIPASSGTHPRALTVTSDGDADDTDEKLYVACFFAELRAGKTGLDEGQDDNREGRVVVVRTADNTIATTIALAPMAVTGFKSNGSVLDFVGTSNGQGGTNATDPANPAANAFDTGAFPNQLAALAVRPGSAFAYVVSTGASPNGPFGFNFNAQGLVSVVKLAGDEELVGDATTTVHQKAPLNLNQGLKQDTATQPVIFQTNPVALAWRPDGSEAWVAIQNSDLLVRMTANDAGFPTINAPVTNGAASIARIDLHAVPAGALEGKAPRGLAINRKGDRLFVQSFVTRALTVVDLGNRSILASVAAAALPATGTPDATVQLGAELFFTGRGPDERMSSESWGGCVICHPDGLSDSITWMFDGGPRQTIPLDGTFNHTNTHDQRILNWSAVRDENADFELNTRNVFGGRGLIEDDRVLFAFGGASGTLPTDNAKAFAFHQLLNTVSNTNILANNAALPGLIGARRDFGVATLDDGRVYVIGGRSGSGNGQLVPTGQAVLEFNPNTNTVRARSASGFTIRHSLGVTAVTTSSGPRIYAIGGYSTDNAGTIPDNVVQEYDPATDAWRTVANLPVVLAEFGIANPGLLNKGEPTQTVHVLGGNKGSQTTPAVSGDVFKFDPDPNGPGVWTKFAFTITPRRNLGAAAIVRGAFPSHVFALGGRNAAGTALATVESYAATSTQTQLTDPTALIATPLSQLPTAMHSFATGTSNNRIYLVGGIDAAGADLATVLELNPAANPAAGTVGAPGTPSGVFATKAPLVAGLRGLGISSPRPVVNFLAVKSSGRDARQDAINEWVKRAVRAPVAKNRGVTNAQIDQGRVLFAQPGLTGIAGISCASCHGGEKWTRSQVDFTPAPSPDLLRGKQEVLGAELRKTLAQPGTTVTNGVLVDVGTFLATRPNEVRPNPTDVGVRVAALGANGFQPPSLLGVGASAPYFHSGLASTLEAVLDGSADGKGASVLKSVHAVTGASERAALVEFLKAIDETTPIFP